MSVAKDISGGVIDEPGISRYDLLLLLLPVPLFSGAIAAPFLGVPTAVGVGLGAVPSALLLSYGLFVDAPVSGTRERRTGRGRTGT